MGQDVTGGRAGGPDRRSEKRYGRVLYRQPLLATFRTQPLPAGAEGAEVAAPFACCPDVEK
jgi:hypothetical protein